MSGTTMHTRLTEFFGIEHPVLLAPMAEVSGAGWPRP
jgi:NAD(P)H-dependent flavin oxidoreductase YrpB (nitropropane dioxygenase family)